jgi:hypothetical protein
LHNRVITRSPAGGRGGGPLIRSETGSPRRRRTHKGRPRREPNCRTSRAAALRDTRTSGATCGGARLGRRVGRLVDAAAPRRTWGPSSQLDVHNGSTGESAGLAPPQPAVVASGLGGPLAGARIESGAAACRSFADIGRAPILMAATKCAAAWARERREPSVGPSGSDAKQWAGPPPDEPTAPTRSARTRRRAPWGVRLGGNLVSVKSSV